jgi:hypothetical protein
MLLWDLTWRERAQWRERAPGYAAVALPVAAYILLRSQSHALMAILFIDTPLVGTGSWTARMTAVKVIGKFMGLFLWPARLSADYSYNCVPVFGWPPVSWEDGKALLGPAPDPPSGCSPAGGRTRDRPGLRCFRHADLHPQPRLAK